MAGCATQTSPPAPAALATTAAAAADACSEIGMASWYHGSPKGRSSPREQVAAHKTLPLGTTVRVTHLDTGRAVDVRINDRGPFGRGRVIDISKSAADALGMRRDGVVRVKLTVDGGVNDCPLEEARAP